MVNMDSSYLYSITNKIELENIPQQWKNINFDRFSESKTLYPYQKEALEQT